MKWSEIPKEYKKAVEDFISPTKPFELTESRFNSLWDMEFGLAMFNAGKKLSKVKRKVKC